MRAEKSDREISSIPSLPLRWYMLFRRYPSLLLDFRFLFDVIIRRSPIFWDNFMEAERRRRSQKGNACFVERPRDVPAPGTWRIDD
jgi:hypothetical protein